MQKHLVAYLSIVTIFIVVVSSVAVITPMLDTGLEDTGTRPFYVGVTYCGDSVEGAKQLIDKVSNYTSLFVIQSGSLIYNVQAIEEIGDYAVNSSLNVLIYCGGGFAANNIVLHGLEYWGDQFLGIYYLDEPGGKMIDKVTTAFGSTQFSSNGFATISLYSNYTGSCDVSFFRGEIGVHKQVNGNKTRVESPIGLGSNQTYIFFVDHCVFSSNANYYPNGTIVYTETKYHELNDTILESRTCIYQPDGTVQDREGNNVTDRGNITQFTPYQELLELYPLGSYAKIADRFTECTLDGIVHGQIQNQTIIKQTMSRLFTSDYALYWFDYKAGYPTVFAEFVGNESRERHIALCRGAAETMGKDWGVMITWKYNQPPYLESDDELYNDLALAYSSGAKYGIVFSYSNTTAYETLTDDHFDALQRFWNTLKTNPASFGKAESKVAYVIPADYGFGFRNANDTIWGHFPADEYSAKIYSDTAALTAKYGAGFNILYDGAETAAKLGSYSTVYYYNQTVP